MSNVLGCAVPWIVFLAYVGIVHYAITEHGLLGFICAMAVVFVGVVAVCLWPTNNHKGRKPGSLSKLQASELVISLREGLEEMRGNFHKGILIFSRIHDINIKEIDGSDPEYDEYGWQGTYVRAFQIVNTSGYFDRFLDIESCVNIDEALTELLRGNDCDFDKAREKYLDCKGNIQDLCCLLIKDVFNDAFATPPMEFPPGAMNHLAAVAACFGIDSQAVVALHLGQLEECKALMAARAEIMDATLGIR